HAEPRYGACRRQGAPRRAAPPVARGQDASAILPLRHCTEGCRKEQSRKGCLHEITRNEGEESHCEHRLVKPDDKAQPKKARRVDSSSGHEGSGDRRPDGATGTSTEKRTCDKGLESKAYEEAAGGTRDIGKADALLG